MKYNNLGQKSIKIKTSNKIRIAILFVLSAIYLFFSNDYVLADDTIVYTDDIYKIAETNGIAKSICNAIEIGKILMIPLFAIMFSILGLSAYQGKVKWSTFITFALGIAGFKAAGAIAEFFMPEMGLQYGCKCAIERKIRDANGVVKRYATGLNYDCSEGTTDYEEEYGNSVISDGIAQDVQEAIEREIENIKTNIKDLEGAILKQQELIGEYEKVEVVQTYLSIKSELATKDNDKNDAKTAKDDAYADLLLYKSFLSKNETSVKNAENSLNDAKSKQKDAEDALNDYLASGSVSAAIKEQLETQLATAKQNVKNAEDALENANKVLQENKQQVADKEKIYNDKVSVYDQLVSEYKNISKNLEEAGKEKLVITYLDNVAVLQNLQNQLSESQNTLEELQSKLSA